MAEPNDGPSMFIGVHLAVADMPKAMNFYRYCEVDDADGHTVGFQSPADESLRAPTVYE